jgi:hypothetical protein
MTELADEERQVMYHDPVAPGPPSLAPATIQGEGLRALERAVEIVDANPDAPPASVAAVRVQLGDLNQIRQAPDRALPHYQHAWRAATGVTEGGRPLQQVLFGEPCSLLRRARRLNRRGPAARGSGAAQRGTRGDREPAGTVRESKVVNDAGDPRFGGARSGLRKRPLPPALRGRPARRDRRCPLPAAVLRAESGAPARARPRLRRCRA